MNPTTSDDSYDDGCYTSIEDELDLAEELMLAIVQSVDDDHEQLHPLSSNRGPNKSTLLLPSQSSLYYNVLESSDMDPRLDIMKSGMLLYSSRRCAGCSDDDCDDGRIIESSRFIREVKTTATAADAAAAVSDPSSIGKSLFDVSSTVIESGSNNPSKRKDYGDQVRRMSKKVKMETPVQKSIEFDNVYAIVG